MSSFVNIILSESNKAELAQVPNANLFYNITTCGGFICGQGPTSKWAYTMDPLRIAYTHYPAPTNPNFITNSLPNRAQPWQSSTES